MPLENVEDLIATVEGAGVFELSLRGIAKLLLCAQMQIASSEKVVPYASVLSAIGEARIIALLGRFRIHFSDLDKNGGADFKLCFTAKEATLAIFAESNQIARADFLLADQILLRKGTESWLTAPVLLGTASNYSKAASACLSHIYGEADARPKTLEDVSIATLSTPKSNSFLSTIERYLDIEPGVAHSAIIPPGTHMSPIALASSLQTNPNLTVDDRFRLRDACPAHNIRNMSPGWIVANRSARATMKSVSSADDKMMIVDSILRFVTWLGNLCGAPSRQQPRCHARHMAVLSRILAVPTLQPSNQTDTFDRVVVQNKFQMEEYWSVVMCPNADNCIDRAVFANACDAALHSREEECWMVAKSYPLVSSNPSRLLEEIKGELTLMDFLAMCIAWEIYFAECRLKHGVDFDAEQAARSVVGSTHASPNVASQVVAASLAPFAFSTRQRQDFLMSCIVESAMLSPVSCPVALTERGFRYQRDQVERPYLGLTFGTDFADDEDKHIMFLSPRAVVRYMSRWAAQRGDSVAATIGREYPLEEDAMRKIVSHASLQSIKASVSHSITSTSAFATEMCNPLSSPTVKLRLSGNSASSTPLEPVSLTAALLELGQIEAWVKYLEEEIMNKQHAVQNTTTLQNKPTTFTKPKTMNSIRGWLSLGNTIQRTVEKPKLYIPTLPPVLASQSEGSSAPAADSVERFSSTYDELKALQNTYNEQDASLTLKQNLRKQLAKNRIESECDLERKKTAHMSRIEQYKEQKGELVASQINRLKQSVAERESILRRERDLLSQEISKVDKNIQQAEKYVPHASYLHESEYVKIPNYASVPQSLGEWEPVGKITVSAVVGKEAQSWFTTF